MSELHEFKYFPNYQTWARFTEDDCNCPLDELCLDGVFFGDPDVPDAICLSWLMAGQYRVEIGHYLIRLLEQSVRLEHPEWSDQQVTVHVDQSVDALSRTPPVPWIQHNNWPVCHGDFCRYDGEWRQDQFIQAAPDGDGVSYLVSILDEPNRERIGDPIGLWESISNGWTTVFVFTCLTCGRRIAVDQSY
jgi:uncharacterized protein CbrC (UPF0167 family)